MPFDKNRGAKKQIFSASKNRLSFDYQTKIKFLCVSKIFFVPYAIITLTKPNYYEKIFNDFSSCVIFL